jgi:hypothetical protein
MSTREKGKPAKQTRLKPYTIRRSESGCWGVIGPNLRVLWWKKRESAWDVAQMCNEAYEAGRKK